MIDYPDVVEITAIKCESLKNSKSSINMQNTRRTIFSSSFLKCFHTYLCLAPFLLQLGKLVITSLLDQHSHCLYGIVKYFSIDIFLLAFCVLD